MSRETVELHRRVLDAFNRRDLDGVLALMDGNVEANSQLVAIEGGYHGHDGIRRWWANLLDTLPDWTLEVVEVRDLGDSTLAVLRTTGHGAGSHIPIEQRAWNPATWREEKCVRWSSHETEAEALEAVGLRE